MNAECMKKILTDSFKDFKFFEKDHHYEFKGKRVGVSVTSLISQYENEFDKYNIAGMVATRDKKNITQVLKEWQYKADFACTKGSTCHEFAQTRWTKEPYVLDKFDNSDEYLNAVLKVQKQAVNFYEDYKDVFESLFAELVVGSEEFDIASAVDHLFYNKLTSGLVLVDYKTNSILKGYNDDGKNTKYAKKMKFPLNNLKDITLEHYHLQLSIYKYLIEKYTELKVDEMFIVYFSENIDNYEIIEVPYLKEEVEKILEIRRIKDMNSVPILLIGKSGSGKSTSLRNFKKDEVAVINVLGKPLPFRSDIKAVKLDDYDNILNQIKMTKKDVIVIDDANYLITNEFMEKSSIRGYDKYNEIANHFFELINGIKNIEGGKTVYLIMHEDTDEEGNVKPKTIGKLLDDKVNIQGMFTICIRAMYENGKYVFRLKTNGQDCVKTPFGMFDTDEMDNDLKAFDSVVREYYGLNNTESEGK